MTTKIPGVVRNLENEMGVPAGFFRDLETSDDWTFVIKGHAFIEGALSHILVHATGREELRPVFSEMETSNAKSGKLAFAKALDLVSKGDRRFVRKFSELRNYVVHDVKNVVFNFETYISSMDKQQLDSFIKAFSLLAETTGPEVNGQEINYEEFAKTLPRLAVYNSLLFFATKIYLKKDVVLIKSLSRMLQQESIKRWWLTTDNQQHD